MCKWQRAWHRPTILARLFRWAAFRYRRWQIEAVSGTQQVVTEGQPVLPVTVLVTQDSIPPYPVFGATVTCLNILSRSETKRAASDGE
jgi:hypothetical protein